VGARALLVIPLLALSVFFGLSGCVEKPPSDTAVPVYGLNSLDQTVTVGQRQYRLEAQFTQVEDRRDIERLDATLHFADFSGPSKESYPDIALEAYAADGTPRVEPAGVDDAFSSSGGSRFPGEGEADDSTEPYAWATTRQSFSVYTGEAGLVVGAVLEDGRDIRWLVR